jgi:hypothetical protein
MPNIGIYKMAKKKRAKPKLMVVFDTNVLYTKVAYELLRREVKELIESNSQHPDLNIKWYLPSVVVDERRYQMQGAAFKLLPSVTELERLLSHNLNITEDILKIRVNDAIEKQLSELGILTLDIDTSQVDWKSKINRAVYRLSPFEPGDKEKGFRDSLIADTFLQLVSQSPTTPSICRLAFVSNDGSLSEYVNSTTNEAKNVRILSAVSELESLINTLVSEATEEFIADIKERITNYFFETENKTGLFFEEKINDKIRESYSEKFNWVPDIRFERENGPWRIEKPIFVKKERQRTFWMTPISIDATLYKYDYPPIPTPSSSDITLGASSARAFLSQQSIDDLISGKSSSFTLPSKPKMIRVNVDNGKIRFEIHWSVNITQRKNFTHPRIEEIKFVALQWDEI